MGFKSIITSTVEGKELMGPDILLYHYDEKNNYITSGSLLTVESNHFAVLKSRGAILNVYETGQYEVQTPDHAVFGSFQRAFYGGQSAGQFEVQYINRSKLMIKSEGIAYSKEMAQLGYDVNCYIHVDSKEDAVKLVTHMPVAGRYIKTKEVSDYATPAIEQAINQIVQVTPLERVNEKINEITEQVKNHLSEFLEVYGITLNSVKVQIYPMDPVMKELISLRAFGLSEVEAVRFHTARIMAEKGLVSAPNMAIGEPYYVGANLMNVAPKMREETKNE